MRKDFSLAMTRMFAPLTTSSLPLTRLSITAVLHSKRFLFSSKTVTTSPLPALFAFLPALLA